MSLATAQKSSCALWSDAGWPGSPNHLIFAELFCNLIPSIKNFNVISINVPKQKHPLNNRSLIQIVHLFWTGSLTWPGSTNRMLWVPAAVTRGLRVVPRAAGPWANPAGICCIVEILLSWKLTTNIWIVSQTEQHKPSVPEKVTVFWKTALFAVQASDHVGWWHIWRAHRGGFSLWWTRSEQKPFSEEPHWRTTLHASAVTCWQVWFLSSFQAS